MHDQNGRRASGLLYSGGLDSAALLLQMLDEGYEVYPIYIASGLNWERAELRAAREFLAAVARPGLAELVLLEMPLRDLYGEHWSVTGRGAPGASSPDEDVFLLGRNPLLAIKARLWCQLRGIDQLAIGCLGSSPFADASTEFFLQFERVMDQAAAGRVRIVRPLTDKVSALRRMPGAPLALTFSCISPRRDLACGVCNKCAERRRAFAAAGLAVEAARGVDHRMLAG